MSIRSKLRFSLFTGLWQLVFGIVVAAGIWKRLRVINSGEFRIALDWSAFACAC